jgi:four helix bundle protein
MLRIGLASAAELHYHLIFSQDIGLISTPEFKMLEERVVEVKRMLSGFIRRLKADG